MSKNVNIIAVIATIMKVSTKIMAKSVMFTPLPLSFS
jgi:hypothetical protein